MATTRMTPQQLVAHRGYQKHYPENTQLAFREAIKAGARFIETDIQFSADGVPILYHDITLDRVSGQPGCVLKLSAAELMQLPAHEPQRFGDRFVSENIASLMALVDLLEAHPTVTAYIELKEESINHIGVDSVLIRVMADLSSVIERVVLISYDLECMSLARCHGFPLVGVVLREWSDILSPMVEQISPDCVFCNYRKIPDHVCLSGCRYPVIVYEVAEPALAHHWLRRGADKIESFDVGALLS